jgi:hypothetical protein
MYFAGWENGWYTKPYQTKDEAETAANDLRTMGLKSAVVSDNVSSLEELLSIPRGVTKEEFEQKYAKRSGVTVEWIHEHDQVATPCECGENGCAGWKMTQRGYLSNEG